MSGHESAIRPREPLSPGLRYTLYTLHLSAIADLYGSDYRSMQDSRSTKHSSSPPTSPSPNRRRLNSPPPPNAPHNQVNGHLIRERSSSSSTMGSREPSNNWVRPQSLFLDADREFISLMHNIRPVDPTTLAIPATAIMNPGVVDRVPVPSSDFHKFNEWRMKSDTWPIETRRPPRRSYTFHL